MTFTISDQQLKNQLDQVSTWTQNHLVQRDPDEWIITADGPRTPRQVAWYLATGQWVMEVYHTCDEQLCLLAAHLTDSQASASAALDEALLDLVQRTSVSLADLYRRGKQRGLLKSMSPYQ